MTVLFLHSLLCKRETSRQTAEIIGSDLRNRGEHSKHWFSNLVGMKQVHQLNNMACQKAIIRFMSTEKRAVWM